MFEYDSTRSRTLSTMLFRLRWLGLSGYLFLYLRYVADLIIGFYCCSVSVGARSTEEIELFRFHDELFFFSINYIPVSIFLVINFILSVFPLLNHFQMTFFQQIIEHI